MELLVDSHHGVYCPQIAVSYLLAHGAIEHTDDTSIVCDGPDNPEYWEAWDIVLMQNPRIVHNEDVWWLDEGEEWPDEWE